jgi:hypothetical protein
MSDTPYAPGGIVPSPGPESDLVPLTQIRLKPGELVMSLERFREWSASGLPLEEWLRQNKLGPHKEAAGDDES